jgi:hypothetical protein
MMQVGRQQKPFYRSNKHAHRSDNVDADPGGKYLYEGALSKDGRGEWFIQHFLCDTISFCITTIVGGTVSMWR